MTTTHKIEATDRLLEMLASTDDTAHFAKVSSDLMQEAIANDLKITDAFANKSALTQFQIGKFQSRSDGYIIALPGVSKDSVLVQIDDRNNYITVTVNNVPSFIKTPDITADTEQWVPNKLTLVQLLPEGFEVGKITMVDGLLTIQLNIIENSTSKLRVLRIQ